MPGGILRLFVMVVTLLAAGGAAADWLDYREEHAIEPYAAVKGWQVYAIQHSSSGFLGCGAVKAEPAGQLVIERYQERWQMVVPTRRSDDDRYDGALISFDGRGIDSQFGFEHGHAVSDLTRDEVGFLQQAGKLTVAINGEKPLRFNLSGSSATILKIRECVERKGVPPGAGPAPVTRDDPAQYVPSVELCMDGLRTETTGRKRKVRFEGAASLDFPFDLYWIDFDGKWQLYDRLAPGQSMEMETYEGHQWVAKLADNDCAYAEITPGLKSVRFEYEDY